MKQCDEVCKLIGCDWLLDNECSLVLPACPPRKAIADGLVGALEDADLAYNVAIDRTPTSSYREKLTERNILRLNALAKLQEGGADV